MRKDTKHNFRGLFCAILEWKNRAQERGTDMLAQDIRTILASFEQAEKDYKWAYDQVGLLDKETQDILHSLELDPINKNERNRLATRLQKVRKQRRVHKDTVQSNEPIVTFLQGEKGRNMLNLLREVLGKTRKVEDLQEIRTYRQKAVKGRHA